MDDLEVANDAVCVCGARNRERGRERETTVGDYTSVTCKYKSSTGYTTAACGRADSNNRQTIKNSGVKVDEKSSLSD